MGYDVLDFDSVALPEGVGESMNRRLREVVQAEKSDLTFSVLFKDALDKRTGRVG